MNRLFGWISARAGPSGRAVARIVCSRSNLIPRNAWCGTSLPNGMKERSASSATRRSRLYNIWIMPRRCLVGIFARQSGIRSMLRIYRRYSPHTNRFAGIVTWPRRFGESTLNWSQIAISSLGRGRWRNSAAAFELLVCHWLHAGPPLAFLIFADFAADVRPELLEHNC